MTVADFEPVLHNLVMMAVVEGALQLEQREVDELKQKAVKSDFLIAWVIVTHHYHDDHHLPVKDAMTAIALALGYKIA